MAGTHNDVNEEIRLEHSSGKSSLAHVVRSALFFLRNLQTGNLTVLF